MTDRGLDTYLVELLYEKITVFRVHDCLYRCAEYGHPIFLQSAVEEQFRATVKGSLSSEGKEDAVGTFLLDDAGYKKRCHWKEINLVSDTFRCLNSSDVRIHKNRTDAFFPEGFQCLGT